MNRAISFIVLAVCLLMPAGASASWIPEVEPLDPSVLEGDPEYPYGALPSAPGGIELPNDNKTGQTSHPAQRKEFSLTRIVYTLWSLLWKIG